MNIPENEILARTALLYGDDVMEKLSSVRVILFGVGGVGGWCAESLIRSGIKHLTLVDADDVAVSNINRQIMATTASTGRPKVEVMKERLLEINPYCEINAVQKVYTEENHMEFKLDSYDYIIDAIDSLKDKISLILHASEKKGRFFSSMGAALKLDPTRVKVAEFWDVNGCPLAAMIRRRMRQRKTFPKYKFLCVYDDEVLENRGSGGVQEGSFTKAQINGTSVHVTAIFGMTLGGLLIKDIYDKCRRK